MKNKFVLWLGCSFLLAACEVENTTPDIKVWGYKPIYGNQPTASDVYLDAPQTVGKKGRMYFKDNYLLLINEGNGVHIIDNSNPDNPQNIKFLAAKGIRNIAIKDSVMFLEMGNTLMSVVLNDLETVTVLETKNGYFKIPEFPSQVGVQFECYDANKGYLLGWQADSIVNPKCYR